MAYYAEIEKIVAPTGAVAGAAVNIQAKIRNLGLVTIWQSAQGRYNNTEFSFSPEYKGAESGALNLFDGSFIMPNKSVRVYVWSHWCYMWEGAEWYLDDEKYVDIDLVEVETKFSELEITSWIKV